MIRHERHVHISPADAAFYGVKDGDRLNLRIKSDCGAVLEGLLVHFFGAQAKAILDKYLEVALIAFIALVILGFVALRYL